MRARIAIAAVLGLVSLGGCAPQRVAEDTEGWWDEGQALEVIDPVEFTDQAYGLDGGVGDLKDDLFPTPGDAFVFAPGDDYGDARCASETDSALPTEITGVVTIPPRFYFKTAGCNNGDEKYYGSFFVEDDTGGVFVLGDSKAAHFTVGDTVTLRVRAVRTRYDLDMVYSWDLVEVDGERRAVRYRETTQPLGPADVAAVRRVEGVVSTEMDTFGAFSVTGDNGQAWGVQLDADLNRRGVRYEVGERVVATGPVIYSYSAYNLVIQSKGQITVLD